MNTHFDDKLKTCITCPTSQPVWNGSVCVGCSGNDFFDSTTKRCLSCPSGLIFDSAILKCKCP